MPESPSLVRTLFQCLKDQDAPGFYTLTLRLPLPGAQECVEDGPGAAREIARFCSAFQDTLNRVGSTGPLEGDEEAELERASTHASLTGNEVILLRGWVFCMSRLAPRFDGQEEVWRLLAAPVPSWRAVAPQEGGFVKELAGLLGATEEARLSSEEERLHVWQWEAP